MDIEEAKAEQIEEEEDEAYSNDDLYNINSWGADLSFRELITMYEEDELLKPELQRKYVWVKTEASRFIESLLMGLPVPSIFLAKVEGNNKLIIDGYQRIMTVYDYVRGVFTTDNKIFKLSNSKIINERWRGKAFKELEPDEQKRIKSTTIHAIIFEQKSPKDKDTSLYQIFERINNSGRTLTPQEIRNCIYQGTFNKLLFKLNTNTDWRLLFGEEVEDVRMKDLELILRFFALGSEDIRNNTGTQISLKKYLNEFMGDKESKSEEILAQREETFTKTMKFLLENLGVNSFHNLSVGSAEELTPRFNPNIFDSISIATAYALDKNPEINSDGLDKKRFELLMDIDFKRYISERTTNIESINGRISLALKYLYSMKYE
ncbi:DUF262 domain-containing protein [Clostridium estertheticum]|uniref:DUF262 domain-containing protein n=1 Tax=Clostridium estertheticum TaxID=238834 RepID=UPI001CF3F581|nr:DUF262 domain-containing protein [Clostridium estertheticum]MCB2354712.1 DUF262 domain-containing protein [Clostridium estertheticum]WAG40954.1 DUF262 domain-containing protein [Clostridium estertheticum]